MQSEMMKALIVEDSRLAREGLLKMLDAFPAVQVVGSADHPASALELIKVHRPEVLFLDIHMPGETGFDLLEKLDYMPDIIFTTAYSEYAYRSFEYSPVDYLLKPISQERLASAIAKLAVPAPAVQKRDEALDVNNKIFIKDGDHCHLITLSSVRYFESCKNYVRVYFEDGNAFVKKALNSVELRLPERCFFRVNRQHIVNLYRIEAIDERIGDGYDITMDDGKRLEVSRRSAAALKKRLSL